MRRLGVLPLPEEVEFCLLLQSVNIRTLSYQQCLHVYPWKTYYPRNKHSLMINNVKLQTAIQMSDSYISFLENLSRFQALVKPDYN